MFRKAASVLFLLFAVITLSSFRMPASGDNGSVLLYDIRGAFVTVGAGIDPALGRAVERHLKSAIGATVRQQPLARAIVSIRIEEMTRRPFLFGHRQKVRFTVRVAAVTNGAVIAAGVYTASAANGWALPEKVARITGKALSLAPPPGGMSVAMALESAFQP